MSRSISRVVGLIGLRCWGMTLLGVEVKCSTQAGTVDVRRSVLRLEHGDTKQRTLTKKLFVEDDILSRILRWITA
jgi:hypothetical protein